MSDPNTKTRWRQYLILGLLLTGSLGLLGIGMFLFDGSPPPAREKPTTASITPPGTMDDKDLWRVNEAARARATETSLAEVQSTLRAQDEANKKMAKELDELKHAPPASAPSPSPMPTPTPATRAPDTPAAARARAAAILDQPLPAGTGGQRLLAPPNAPSARQVGKPEPSMSARLNTPLDELLRREQAPAQIEMISFGVPPDAETPNPPSPSDAAGQPGHAAPSLASRPSPRAAPARMDDATVIELLPAGSFVRVGMLNGVDAPTGGQAQSNPLTIALHVLDSANLANKYRLDIKDCRFIAAAWGDLSSERTMGRTESLTCIVDGKAMEIPVKGQLMGEDGKQGIRGRLVTKQGQLLANALFAGSLAGIGHAFQAAATTTTAGGGGITQTIEPDKVAQAGVGGGVGTAANMLAQYYLKAADKLYPVIETDGGRIVEVLITKGATLTLPRAEHERYGKLLRRPGQTAGAAGNDD